MVAEGSACPTAQSNSTVWPNTSDTGWKVQEAQARQLSQTPHADQISATQDGRSRKHKPGSSVELHAPAKHQRRRTVAEGRACPAAQLNSTVWPNTSNTGWKEQEAQARQLSRTPRFGQTPAIQDGRSRKRKHGSSVELHTSVKHQRYTHMTHNLLMASPATYQNDEC